MSATVENNAVRNINVYIINAKHLTQRLEKFMKVIQYIAQQAKLLGYGNINCNTMRVYDKEDIEANLKEYADRISYDKTNSAVYDGMIEQLSVEVISNIEKHKHCWKIISQSLSANDNDLNLIMEDDAMILNDHLDNVKDMLTYMKDSNNDSQWDLLFLGLTQRHDTSGDFTIAPTSSIYEHVICSKEAYFINRSTAKRMYDSWCTNKVTHSLRIQLSKYLENNKDIKAMFTNRRVTIDGSKLGFFPTSIHRGNFLSFNSEFNALVKLYHGIVMALDTKNKEESMKLFQEAKKIYKVTQSQPTLSSDFSNVYGMILAKLEKYDEAEEIFARGLKDLEEQQGLINGNTEILVNAVNNYRFLQTDVAGLFAKKSKYETDEIPMLDFEPVRPPPSASPSPNVITITDV